MTGIYYLAATRTMCELPSTRLAEKSFYSIAGILEGGCRSPIYPPLLAPTSWPSSTSIRFTLLDFSHPHILIRDFVCFLVSLFISGNFLCCLLYLLGILYRNLVCLSPRVVRVVLSEGAYEVATCFIVTLFVCCYFRVNFPEKF